MRRETIGSPPARRTIDDGNIVLAKQLRGALDAAGPSQANISTADRRAVGDQLQAVAGLVDAEQCAAECDLADQAFPVWGVVEMDTSAEQPIVKPAGLLQVTAAKAT